jgi:hypothetical protein
MEDDFLKINDDESFKQTFAESLKKLSSNYNNSSVGVDDFAFSWETPKIKHTAYENVAFKEQFAEFESIVNSMLELHKSKMNDYSEWNMKGTGELGAIVRIWDKTARLMNLYGFDIGTGTFKKPVNPNFESIEDNLTDLANYAIITMILRKGKWGK